MKIIKIFFPAILLSKNVYSSDWNILKVLENARQVQNNLDVKAIIITLLVFCIIILLLYHLYSYRKLKLSLEESKDIFNDAFINSGEIIYRIDLKTNEIDYISPVIFELLGYSASEIIDMGPSFFNKLIHPLDKDVLKKNYRLIFKKTKTDNQKITNEYRMLCKNGEYKWFHDTMRVVRDKKGNPLYLFGNNRDVDLKRRTELEIKKSKERLGHAFIGTGFGLWELNLDPLDLYFNNEWLNLFGYKKEDIKDNIEFLFALIHPDDRIKVKEVLDKFSKGEKILFELECRVKAKSGVYHWVFTRGKVLCRDENGTPNRFMGMNLDVTERKVMEEAIKDNEIRFRMLVEKLPVMIDAFDDENNIVFWNEECEKITGYSKKEIINNPEALKMLYPDEKYRKEISEFWKLRKGPTMNWELWVTCKNKSRRLISWFNTSGVYKVPGWGTWAIGIDITEQRNYKEKLENSKADLEIKVAERTIELIKANRLKDEFLAYISHEFRTPMSNILINISYLIRQGVLQGNNYEKLESINKSVNSAVNIIDEVLDISQIEKGTLRIEKIVFDIEEIVEEIITSLQEQINDKEILVVKNISIKTIFSDIKRIRQVLMNLITNAIKYTNAGKIIIDIYEEESQIMFSVKDTGIGIDKENLDKIFAPFYRASRSEYKAKGMGLGLTICKKILDALEGEMNVQSKLGEGSTFAFSIPKENSRSI